MCNTSVLFISYVGDMARNNSINMCECVICLPVTTNSKLVNWSRKHQLLFELGGEWLTWSFSGCGSVVVGWAKGSVNCETPHLKLRIQIWWIQFSKHSSHIPWGLGDMERCRDPASMQSMSSSRWVGVLGSSQSPGKLWETRGPKWRMLVMKKLKSGSPCPTSLRTKLNFYLSLSQ